MESDAFLYSNFDKFTSNYGFLNGGGLFAITRSYFSILNSKFSKNYASSNSAISAFLTSTSPFKINNCIFINNTANSNTISL